MAQGMTIGKALLIGLAVAAAIGLIVLMFVVGGASEEAAKSFERMSELDTESLQYALMNLEIKDLEVRRYVDANFGPTVGIFGTLVNKGDKPMQVVYVTVYFKGADGETLAKEESQVFHSDPKLLGSKPLAPGNMHKIHNRFEFVPADWNPAWGYDWEFSKAQLVMKIGR